MQIKHTKICNLKDHDFSRERVPGKTPSVDRSHLRSTRVEEQRRGTDLSKWLKAATTVSFAKLYETDTLANQLTTAPRMSRNSVFFR